jgi:hypothetical protein
MSQIQYSDPRQWGSHFWFIMRCIAHTYPINPNKEDAVHVKNFFMELQSVLPCEICKYTFKQHLNKHPIERNLSDRNKLIEWVELIYQETNKAIQDKRVKIMDISGEEPEEFAPIRTIYKSRQVNSVKTKLNLPKPPKEQPKEQPKELPKEPLKELPKELPKEQPKELPKEQPKELPKEQPKEQPKELPKEQLKELPKELPPKSSFPKGIPKISQAKILSTTQSHKNIHLSDGKDNNSFDKVTIGKKSMLETKPLNKIPFILPIKDIKIEKINKIEPLKHVDDQNIETRSMPPLKKNNTIKHSLHNPYLSDPSSQWQQHKIPVNQIAVKERELILTRRCKKCDDKEGKKI